MRNWIRQPIVWILAIALLLRVAAALYLGNVVSGLSGANDEITYSMLGHRVVQGFGLTFPENWYPWIKANAPQSYFSAAISYYLAAIYAIFGYQPIVARLVTAVIGTAVVWMIYRLSLRLFGERVALVAAAIAAVYAYLIFYSVTLVTETPFMAAVLLALLVSYSLVDKPTFWKWLVLGAVLALAVLLRMAVVFFVPFLLGWVALHLPNKRWHALVPLVVIVLAVAPFTLHNYSMWGRFLLLEAQFGHVFWNGNHPASLGNFHPYRVFPIPAEVLALNNDVDITNRLLQMGIQNIVDDPGLFVMLTVTRLREFFTFWPTGDSGLLANVMRVGSFGITLPFALAGLWLSRGRWRDLAPIYLFVLIHTGVYAATWTMIRYRIPVDAVLIPFAALAVVSLFDWLRVVSHTSTRSTIASMQDDQSRS